MAGLTRDLRLQYSYIEDMAEWQALPGISWLQCSYIEDMAEWQALPGISWLQCSYIEDMAEWQALPGISGFNVHILKTRNPLVESFVRGNFKNRLCFNFSSSYSSVIL